MNSKIRFLYFFFALSVLLLGTQTAEAFDILKTNTNGAIIFDKSQTAEDYIITGGKEVNLRGTAKDGALILAVDANLASDFANHVTVIAGEVTISGKIKGNLIALADKVNIDTTSTIEGDVLIFGSSSIFIAGNIKKNLIVKQAGELNLTGNVTGNVDFDHLGKLRVSGSSRIDGNIKGISDTPPVFSPQTIIGGENKITTASINKQRAELASSYIFALIGILLFVTALKYLYPKLLISIRDRAYDQPLRSMGLGLIILIVLPIFIFSLLLLPFTRYLGTFLILFWLVLIIVSVSFSYLWLGDAFTGKKLSPFISVTIGILLVSLISFIPSEFPIGIITLAMFFAGSGAVGHTLLGYLRKT